MKKCLTVIIFFVFLFFVFLTSWSSVRADELEEITKQLSDLQQAYQQSIEATKPLESELKRLEQEFANIEKRIGVATEKIKALEVDIFEREVDLGVKKEILARRVRSYYISSRRSSPLLVLFSSGTASQVLRDLSYRMAATEQDKKFIVDVSMELIKLAEDKEQVEEDKVRLAALQKKVDEQAAFFRKEVTSAKEYQKELSSKIAELTAKQQSLLAEKLASLNLPTSLGAGPLYCTDDRNLDPGFSPAFAFYTYGIPHRVGMNQYGAYGRAKAGQSYQDILHAYYEGISIEKRDNINIKVQGYGEMPLETYLLGVYEMPEGWPIEALKAQVVAARSYALAYTNNGAGEICTSQSCQVYKGGNKGGNWEAAVRATEGEVAVNGGQVITAWYASTSGGYTFLSSDVGWSYKPWTKRLRDTSGDVGSFSDLMERAYDRESPCFYAAQGWRNEYGKSAWLKVDEVADIVNVLLLAKADSSVQSHLSQVDKPNPDGVETWDAGRVKQELQNRNITFYNSVSSVSVGWDKGLGRTTTVNVSGDGGGSSFDGGEFKNYFNLRAPANIQIVGPLFNTERK